jgi:hypothetical protein
VTAKAGELTRRPSEEDEALAAYNDFLQALSETNTPKTWRKR